MCSNAVAFNRSIHWMYLALLLAFQSSSSQSRPRTHYPGYLLPTLLVTLLVTNFRGGHNSAP